MMHFFEEKAAERYGVVPAVILQNIFFWCEKNRANGTNFHDGHYWTYNSEKAFATLFGYLTKWQIRTALKKLQDEGAILTGNYNQSAYDRTLWYTVTEEAIKLLKPDYGDSKEPIPKLQISNLGIGEMQNQNCESATPIPDIKPDRNLTDIKPDKNQSVDKPTRKKPEKGPHGEYGNVKLTAVEHERLVHDYGLTATEEAIKFLDEYIEEKGYKSKSHNLALRRWVFNAVLEHKNKSRPQNRDRMPNGDYDWDNL